MKEGMGMLKLLQNTTIPSVNKTPAIYIAGDEEKPAVLIAHGIMGCKNEYLKTSARISEMLESQGFASLRIDFCGHGDSKVNLSSFSLSSQIQDLCAAIEWLNGKGYSRVSLVGISFGAPPVLIVSQLFSKSIDKCVLIAPVIDYKRTFLYPETPWGKEYFGVDKVIKGIEDGGIQLDAGYVLSPRVLTDILLVDIPSIVSNPRNQITIFHGNCDNMVPLAASMDISVKNEAIKVCVMDKTEHGLTEEGDEKFATEISVANLQRVVAALATTS